MRKTRLHSTSIPAIGEGKRGEDGHIGYLLRQAHAAHRIRMEKTLQAMGVTLPQFSVLTMLAAYPDASGAELARLSLLTPQTMSVIIGNLERAEIVSRTPHAEHGRIQIIQMTPAGRRLLKHCKAAVSAAEKELLADVCAEDETVIRQWLVAVAKRLDNMA